MGHAHPGRAGPGPQRFSALHTKVAGISQKMLSHNLKSLVRAGLVARSVNPTVPPQVTYSLTPLGADLAEQLCALIHWFGAHTGELFAAQSSCDRAVATSDAGAETGAGAAGG
ncbi:winged helix-turn-helix transcriptional regulator [Nonomuraea lactucae]|uniref:winged helix-turn-helix transcriptional regulator n=1 Tax=Nonomuraea lactucae TaxID=2249762 RepID=UPI001966BF6F|nr:helix-turn-helix domain-containing protein [Nonomuraea lactucae]